MTVPRTLGYRFPAEWEKHEATWLTYPFLDDSFPGKLESVYAPYIEFIKHISRGEKVRINVPDEIQKQKLTKKSAVMVRHSNHGRKGLYANALALMHYRSGHHTWIRVPHHDTLHAIVKDKKKSVVMVSCVEPQPSFLRH